MSLAAHEQMDGLSMDEGPAEERLRLLVDSIRDYAVIMISPGGIVESWNRGAEEINGYTPTEIVGRHFSVFYPPDSAASGAPARALEIASREGRYEEEGWRVRKDGSRFWAGVVVSSIRNPSGDLLGFSKVTRDLTEKRAVLETLRQSEERFRLLVSSVKEYAIFMLDPAGHVVTWNAGAEAIKGYRADEIVGSHIERFYSASDAQAGLPRRLLAQAAAEGRVEHEGWRIRKDGSKFWADVVITAVRDADGRLRGFAKVTRDLTARKSAEDERVRLAQAEEAIRLRDEFLAIAAHELKTPLTALHLQLHAARTANAPSPTAAQKIDRAIRSTQRMSSLIESLLDVSRIATGRFQMHFEPGDLGAAVAGAAEEFRETAHKANAQLRIDLQEGIVTRFDNVRIEQVVGNLISNAIKYAPEAPIHVTLVRAGDEARLEVRDHGPGVKEQDMARIFERFERAVPIRHYGGLGLGLFVAREIVHAHGGRISAKNAKEGGAVFTVELPIVAGSA